MENFHLVVEHTLSGALKKADEFINRTGYYVYNFEVVSYFEGTYPTYAVILHIGKPIELSTVVDELNASAYVTE